MSNIAYFIFVIIVFVVAFMFVKKVAGCLIKTIIFAIIAVILAVIYFKFLGGTCPVTL